MKERCITVERSYKIISRLQKSGAAKVFILFPCLAFVSSPAFSAMRLEDLLQKGLASYPGIQSKLLMQESAQSDVTASKLKFLPSPSISNQRNRLSNETVAGQSANSTTIGVTQPVFTGGGLVYGYQKASAKLTAADYAVLEAQEDVAKRIIAVYSDWLRSYRKILALEDSVNLHKKFTELIRRRAEAGVASVVDRDLGISRLNQAQADLSSQYSAEKTALASLSEYVGEPVARKDLTPNIAQMVSLPVRDEAIQNVISTNPTIKRYTYEAEASEAEAAEVRAAALPQVSFQIQRQTGNPYVPGARGYDLAGFVLQYAPGGGLSSFANASSASNRAKASAQMIETAKREISSSVNADFNEYEFSKLRFESLRNSASLSSLISDSYDRQYLAGRKSWLDLMNAVRERSQTMLALADAEASALLSSQKLQILIKGVSELSK